MNQGVTVKMNCRTGAGFTLLEMLVVLAIIAILATLVMPSNANRHLQQQVLESVELIERYKGNLEAFYSATGAFPADNEAANMPEPDKIIGSYVQRVDVENGAMHLQFGKKFPESLSGKRLSLRPMIVEGSPNSPVSWVCGFDAVPEGMAATVENQTDLELRFLPLRCR
ncbi:MAG TPA: prepilin-type cleavage/methylation domain-containing protein [Spongiibacteraceae bacterium]|nr:prepilin-type cleavage/methylation domain-containing protein [Spongiibacteraceae bacterium]HCS28325.1 prepilin-type cleavage/methylation domain-containing protein [Spongiibacteraceae bacterium]